VPHAEDMQIYPRMRAGVLVVAILLAAVFAVVAGAAQGVTPGKSGLIYFEDFNEDTQSSDIYTINSNGTGEKAITTSKLVNETEPAVSPSGRQIAFVSDEGGESYRLHLANSDGTGEHSLPTGGTSAGSPAWSPDGTLITFSRCVAEDEETGDCMSAQIAEIGANGQNLRFLTRATTPASVDARPSWRPDGRAIVFQRLDDEGSVSLWKMNPAGGSLKKILDDGSDVDRSPSFEPRSGKFVFSSDVGGPLGIWRVNANGHGKFRLFTEPPDPDDPAVGAGVENPAVSPDGKQIVYTSGGDLWTAAINGANRKQLTTEGGDEADWAHG
jgi:Tol biopolymer transport system component